MPQWRHRFSEIASKKVKTASNSAISTTNGSNAETKRLRFLNKKPLCLQYNLAAGRKALAKAKRREPSLVYAFVVGAVSLMKWILETAQREVTDFLLKPVDEPMMQEDGGVSVKGSAIPILNPLSAGPHLPKYGSGSMARMAVAGRRLLINRKICSKSLLATAELAVYARLWTGKENANEH
ncbi:unnamed protein product, partial [Mesorhabditis belari]|uniref:Uncharacterized protein n=1 Tax=Mesorhabditis belari TaxID=2138241 RepID=A0AAF3F0Z4_9BILA